MFLFVSAIAAIKATSPSVDIDVDATGVYTVSVDGKPWYVAILQYDIVANRF